MKRSALLVVAVVVFLVSAICAHRSATRVEEVPAPAAVVVAVPAPPPRAEVLRARPAPVVAEARLPASLADFPRTPEFERGLDWLRNSGGQPPENTEGLLDFRLRFLDGLRACMGTLPPAGAITFELLFQPGYEDGQIRRAGRPGRFWAREMEGLRDDEVRRLEDCARVAYRLPLDLQRLPLQPDFHLFVAVRFPVDENAYPFRLLRTGAQ